MDYFPERTIKSPDQEILSTQRLTQVRYYLITKSQAIQVIHQETQTLQKKLFQKDFFVFNFTFTSAVCPLSTVIHPFEFFMYLSLTSQIRTE